VNAPGTWIAIGAEPGKPAVVSQNANVPVNGETDIVVRTRSGNDISMEVKGSALALKASLAGKFQEGKQSQIQRMKQWQSAEDAGGSHSSLSEPRAGQISSLPYLPAISSGKRKTSPRQSAI
jgi:hypothetical protein